jgi:amidase
MIPLRHISKEEFNKNFISSDKIPENKKPIKGKKIAILREGFGQDGQDSGFPAADPRVDEKVKAAIHAFKKLGAEVEEISMPEHLQGYFIWSLIITLGSAEFMLKGSGLGSNWKGHYNTSLGEAFARGMKARRSV